MELLLSAERLPKFGGLAPNTLAILYLDANTLLATAKFKDRS